MHKFLGMPPDRQSSRIKVMKMSTHTTPLWFLRSVSVLTDEHTCGVFFFVQPFFLLCWSVYWASSVDTLAPPQVAQAYGQILQLELVWCIQMQTGLLLRLEVGDAMEPRADGCRCDHVERDERRFAALHTQLESPIGLILFFHVSIAGFHVQEVGPGAVDVDPVILLAGDTHLVAAGNDQWQRPVLRDACEAKDKVWGKPDIEHEQLQMVNEGCVVVTHLRWSGNLCGRCCSVKKRKKTKTDSIGVFQISYSSTKRTDALFPRSKGF